MLNDPKHLEPERGAGAAADADAFPGLADILAGEAAGDDIDAGEIVAGERADVFEPLDVWPVLREDGARPRVGFALPDGPEASGPLKAVLKSADAGEEASEPEGSRTHDDPPSVTAWLRRDWSARSTVTPNASSLR